MRKPLSQEWLKIVACITMLIDHTGAVFFPQQMWMRIVGRIAFPIYCFLLCEGVAHTHNVKNYAARLLAVAVLSEFSFDYLFFGRITFAHQSVMITLLLSLGMLLWARKLNGFTRILPLAAGFLAAELMKCDYGGWGVALVWVFMIAREQELPWLAQTVGMGVLFWLKDGAHVHFGSVYIPLQMFALLAMIPISLYSGKKVTRSKWLRWSLYLFYPAHLTALLAICVLIR